MRGTAPALQAGFRNKNDPNDAHGIADLMRVNKYRLVGAKSLEARRSKKEPLRLSGADAFFKDFNCAPRPTEMIDPIGPIGYLFKLCEIPLGNTHR